MKHKTDINIAKRCYEYLIAKYGSVSNASKHTQIRRGIIYNWANGTFTPSAYYLQYLTQLGADPKYLLTGKRGVIKNVNL